MKGFFLIIIVFVLSLRVSSQELVAKSFRLNIDDLSARTEKRLDANGNLCALIKVEVVPVCEFGGNIIGSVEKRLGTYWVYVCAQNPSTNKVLVSSKNFQPIAVEFSKFGITSIEGGATYILRIEANYQTSSTEMTDSVILVNRMKALMDNLSQVEFRKVGFRRGKLFPFRQKVNGWYKYGFLDNNLKEVIPAQYRSIAGFEDVNYSGKDWAVDVDYHWVADSNLLYGLIDSKGNLIVPFKYTEVYEPYESLSYARIVLAMDSLDQGFVLNRTTGEVIKRIPKFEKPSSVDEGRFVGTPVSVLHFTDTKKHKNYFIDKITGEKREIKIPRGYYFREWLPFNLLSVNNYNNRNQKIIEYDGCVVTEDFLFCGWPGPYGKTISRQYQYTAWYDGIFDLQKRRYIYKGTIHDRFWAISSNIIKIEYRQGIESGEKYLALDTGIITDEKPDLQNTDTELTAIRKSVRRFFEYNDHNFEVITIDDGIYLAQSSSKSIMINKYGSVINEDFEVSSVIIGES